MFMDGKFVQRMTIAGFVRPLSVPAHTDRSRLSGYMLTCFVTHVKNKLVPKGQTKS